MALYMAHFYLNNTSGTELTAIAFDRVGRQMVQHVDSGKDTTVHFEAEEDNGFLPLPDTEYSYRCQVKVRNSGSLIFDRDLRFHIQYGHHAGVVAMDDPLRPGSFIVEPIPITNLSELIRMDMAIQATNLQSRLSRN